MLKKAFQLTTGFLADLRAVFMTKINKNVTKLSRKHCFMRFLMRARESEKVEKIDILHARVGLRDAAGR